MEDSTTTVVGDEGAENMSHPVEPRSRTAMLPPVLVCFPMDGIENTVLIVGGVEQGCRHTPAVMARVYGGLDHH